MLTVPSDAYRGVTQKAILKKKTERAQQKENEYGELNNASPRVEV